VPISAFLKIKYRLTLREKGQSTSLEFAPVRCRVREGPVQHGEVVIVRVSIPKTLSDAEVVYPRKEDGLPGE